MSLTLRTEYKIRLSNELNTNHIPSWVPYMPWEARVQFLKGLVQGIGCGMLSLVWSDGCGEL